MSSGNGGCPNHILLLALIFALNFTFLSGLPTLSESGRRRRLFSVNDSGGHLDDTVRADPLDGLKKYRGGYDVTNKHYWSSTAFTGFPGYILAAIWLFSGVGYGGFLLVRMACCNGRKKANIRLPCSNNCHLWPLLFAVFFTVLAVLGCGLVLGGNAKFHSTANTVIDIIIDTADEASDTIYTTTGAMKEMSTSLGRVTGNSQATRFLTSTSERLDKQADDIHRQAAKNRRLIDKGIKIVYIVTTVAISLTLTTVLALLALGVLKFQRIARILIVLCWIFTVICWLFFGIYLFLQNFAGDTCTALKGFQEDPYNNSLSSILPCDELLSAKSVLSDVSAEIYDMVNEVNLNISTSYGSFVQICNPFSPPPSHDYQPWDCPPSSIPIGNIPRMLRLLVCPDDAGGETCNGGILVAANEYYTVEAYTTSIQRLLDVYPGMESLVECQTVKDAFGEILESHCGPLKRYVRIVWASAAFLSIVMAALVLVWTVGAAHSLRRHSGGSVKPQDGGRPSETIESGVTKDETFEGSEYH
ncbi:uncharacterized protein LOC127242741 [Andrographis paniculata]|uniref:uncharacterized protein LOC127242741 n=1 Tax=Andrographis paniculata TaxID=175694 RepID=UPI0021E9AC97|nr:uncharacterized protein LOC127242741 [Andrographis paniculata]XP_051118378.1 uncharacterized protein LOC127242741 [Andrographis paniculata]